jgi:antitoxin (DNA-binding transcriptional repressor) of toxin-antitoxin stability system
LEHEENTGGDRNIPADGIIITKRGKPIAKVVRVVSSCSEMIGSVPNLASAGDDFVLHGNCWDAESRHSHMD